jgi:hypothetical protein
MDHACRHPVRAEGGGSASRAVLGDQEPNREAAQRSPGHAYAGTVTREPILPSDLDDVQSDVLPGEESDADDDVRLDAI